MQFVEVPDMDVPPEGSSAGMSSSENGPPISDRKRAMPRFTELPDAIPENMKQVVCTSPPRERLEHSPHLHQKQEQEQRRHTAHIHNF